MTVRALGSAAAAGALLALTACASIRPYEAGPDVHALLLAVRDDDHQAFEAYIDRPALRANLQAQLVERSREAGFGRGATALGVLLSGPASHLAEGLLIQPQVLRAVAYYYGYRPHAPVPSPLAIGSALRPTKGGAVCAPIDRAGPCLTTFALEGRTWRLVDIDLSAAEALARRR